MIRKIDFIVIHCTSTALDTDPQSILNYWKNSLKWKNPGYHILITKKGFPVYLQPFDKPSNGVRGYNHNSIHISYIGGQHKDDRTEAQKLAIIQAIREAQEYSHPNKPIIQGHRDFPNVRKACPQFDAKIEYLKI